MRLSVVFILLILPWIANGQNRIQKLFSINYDRSFLVEELKDVYKIALPANEYSFSFGLKYSINPKMTISGSIGIGQRNRAYNKDYNKVAGDTTFISSDGFDRHVTLLNPIDADTFDYVLVQYIILKDRDRYRTNFAMFSINYSVKVDSRLSLGAGYRLINYFENSNKQHAIRTEHYRVKAFQTVYLNAEYFINKNWSLNTSYHYPLKKYFYSTLISDNLVYQRQRNLSLALNFRF